MVIGGKLIHAKREAKEFNGKKGEEKLHITLAEVDLSPEQFEELEEVYKDSGKQFTPEWVKDFKGFVNLATAFELPAMWIDGTKDLDLEKLIVNNKWHSANVLVSINLKTGAVYPKAIKFLTEGKPYNPFEDFETM